MDGKLPSARLVEKGSCNHCDWQKLLRDTTAMTALENDTWSIRVVVEAMGNECARRQIKNLNLNRVHPPPALLIKTFRARVCGALIAKAEHHM
eukprot:5938924-Pyramimonas_sp.AAC.1